MMRMSFLLALAVLVLSSAGCCCCGNWVAVNRLPWLPPARLRACMRSMHDGPGDVWGPSSRNAVHSTGDVKSCCVLDAGC